MRNRSYSKNNNQPSKGGNWVNLRDDAGNIQARYHPKLRLLIIQERKTKTLHDLTKYEPPCQAEKTVL